MLNIKKNKNKKNNIFKLILGSFILSFSLYFFIVPLQLTNGGLETFLKFLFLIYRKFEHSYKIKPLNSYVIISGHVIFLILGLLFLGKRFFFNTILVIAILMVNPFLLEQLGIDKNSFIKIIDSKKSFEFIIKAIIIISTVSFSVVLIINNKSTVGGIGIIHCILKKKTHISLFWIMLLTDGLVIFFSFLLDLDYYINNGTKEQIQEIFWKYVQSIFIFITIIIGISQFTKKNKK